MIGANAIHQDARNPYIDFLPLSATKISGEFARNPQVLELVPRLNKQALFRCTFSGSRAAVSPRRALTWPPRHRLSDRKWKAPPKRGRFLGVPFEAGLYYCGTLFAEKFFVPVPIARSLPSSPSAVTVKV